MLSEESYFGYAFIVPSLLELDDKCVGFPSSKRLFVCLVSPLKFSIAEMFFWALVKVK